MNQTTNHTASKNHQFGGGLLPVVAVAGVVMVMTQGTIFYKAKTSSHFLNEERSRIMALQTAEAGVEASIADLGSRRVTITENMSDHVVASDVQVGNGAFTTTLTTLAMGDAGDTVDLVSTGQVSQKMKTIQAKLRLRNAYDTNQVILAVSNPETTYTITSTVRFDTTATTTIQDPFGMPALNTTAAYAACMSGAGNKCEICHLTHSDVNTSEVISVSKPAIHTHVSHHGDYVTTDGTCDIYTPKITYQLTPQVVLDTNMQVTASITYDTSMAVDTLVRVQVLSWR
jgi:hypothetical protein